MNRVDCIKTLKGRLHHTHFLTNSILEFIQDHIRVKNNLAYKKALVTVTRQSLCQ